MQTCIRSQTLFVGIDVLIQFLFVVGYYYDVYRFLFGAEYFEDEGLLIFFYSLFEILTQLILPVFASTTCYGYNQ
mgnify:CR=1 FL=1